MEIQEALSKFPFSVLGLALKPRQLLKLPVWNKGNTLRGAFGTSFRRLVCVPECHGAHACPLAETCPYKLIFEPSPPPGSGRLSKNQDIPRPFVFRPPLNTKTTYQTDEVFEFELVLLGSAVNYLPYFVLAFREITNSGFGLNRARCELSEVRAIQATGEKPQAMRNGEQPLEGEGLSAAYRSSLSTGPLIYSSADQVFHQPQIPTLGDYVRERLAQFVDSGNPAPAATLFARHSSLVTVFLTPTCLRADGQLVRQPEFHHLFKRLRDRLNALSTFYGPGPIDADFKALGEAAERVRTVKRDVRWIDRYRTSSKTHQRHELSGFIGSCVYNFSDVDCVPSSGGDLRTQNQSSTETEPHSLEGARNLLSISNPDALMSAESITSNPNAPKGERDFRSGISNQTVFSIFAPWLLAGEIFGVGRHSAFGCGYFTTNRD